MFHIYLLYMNMEPCDYSMQYGEAMHVKHTASMETQIGKEYKLCKTSALSYLKVKGSKSHRKNRSYTCIAETCVLHSDCELKHDSSTTIT